MKPTKEIVRELLSQDPSSFEPNSLNGFSVVSVGGGCISDAYRVRADDGDWFVKSNDVSFEANFQAESEGLRQLAAVAERMDGIVVPQPRAVAVVAGASWLVMDWHCRSDQQAESYPAFGRSLARFHRESVGVVIGDAMGEGHDNFLGAARQLNAPLKDWTEFVAQQRIGFQLRWAVDQGLADRQLVDRCHRVMTEMSSLLSGREQSTSLLHGDLWSGNFFWGESGNTVMIDPAAYRGCREAEFGMLKLFGGCPGEFYEAYDDEFPLADGCWRRVSVYVLYHLLNHLNLFGSGYLDQCRQVAGDILRSR
ncbi:Fructosamine kinase [Rubripirellula amarantea]|uniref:Fructosamine kinase n=1 Tax=Rubripirellula amarantea TaxID=2527999 RepID=A0A5C5WUI5_9BACT|nr:fructosamine kinase family protein [Rubripirellula amarantea]TWT53909.1 Fructosamine kinase [Rubripirellula amarantea]